MAHRHRRSHLGPILGGVLTLLVVVGAVAYAEAPSGRPAHAGEAVGYTPAATPPAVAFLGDSYTDGSQMNKGGQATVWDTLLAKKYHWQRDNFGVGGTGFVNGDTTQQDFGSRVATIVSAQPAAVFIAGGHNDVGHPLAQVETAAAQVITEMHQRLPSAKLVVVAPIWPTATPPKYLLALRDALRIDARAVHAVFIDPIAGNWLQGHAASYIGSDGTHPTDAGHAALFRYIDSKLTAAHFVLPATPAP